MTALLEYSGFWRDIGADTTTYNYSYQVKMVITRSPVTRGSLQYSKIAICITQCHFHSMLLLLET